MIRRSTEEGDSLKLKKNSLPFREIALKHKYNIQKDKDVVLIEEKNSRVVAEVIRPIVIIIV